MGIDQFIGLYSVLCSREKRGINSRRAFQFAHGWAVQNLTKQEWQELPKILQFGLASLRPNFAQTYKDLTVKELVKVVQIWRGRADENHYYSFKLAQIIDGADSPTISKTKKMETEQNEIIRNCLMQEYSVGGVAGMGELLADANGIGREYAALIMQLSRCSNAIIAGLDGSGYFSPSTGAYNQFNIKIGQKETAQVYDARLKFVLPYAVQAWIENEPLRLYFVQYKPKFYKNNGHRQQVLGTEHQIATSLKEHIKSRLDWLKSDWIISLQINYALGEILIPKSE